MSKKVYEKATVEKREKLEKIAAIKKPVSGVSAG